MHSRPAAGCRWRVQRGGQVVGQHQVHRGVAQVFDHGGACLAKQFVALALGAQHAPQGLQKQLAVGAVGALAGLAGDFDGLDLVLDGGQCRGRQLAQRCAHFGGQPGRGMDECERVHEGRFFERVGHVVGLAQAVHHRQPARAPLGALARVHEQVVGLALPVFGAQHLGLGLCGIAGVIQRVAQALGQRVRVGGVLGQQVEFKGALAQHAGQQQVRFVGHQ